jgi:hypothetical protein
MYEGARVVERERRKKKGENARCQDGTQTLLHTDVFTQKHFYAHTPYTQIFFYRQTFLHTNTFQKRNPSKLS